MSGSMKAPVPRRRAISLLEADRARIVALCVRLSPRAMVRPGLGGGTWSPADLLGHLESWEEHALGALDAWGRGEPAPIDRALRTKSVAQLNAAEVRRKASRTGAQAKRSAARTHAALLTRLRELGDDVWLGPATARARTPLGHRLGQILVGRRDPFRHDEAHLADLRAFVAEHGSR